MTDTSELPATLPSGTVPSGPVPAGPVPAGPMGRAGDRRHSSRMVGVTNWLVSKATGALEKRTSRRGFLVGSAMVGSAVAVSGCMVATQPGTPYNHITDCGGGLCTDGYTEFCCVINDGLNSCPPDSFPGGWWRAEGSRWCGNSTRYYIDCMQYCCGPKTGYQNFCAGCQECRCAGGCDTRKVYCNYFRYGQCHTEITETGPIACRVVTCTPPYDNAEMACFSWDAADQSTVDHGTGCLTTLPHAPVLPALGAIINVGEKVFGVAMRTGIPGDVRVQLFNSAIWLDPQPVLDAGINSGLTSATDNTGAYIFARGFLGALFYNRITNGTWDGQKAIAGRNLTSDPVAIRVSNTQIRVYARSNTSYENEVVSTHIDNGVWGGTWYSQGGYATSNLSAVRTNNGQIHLFSRGYDGALYWRRVDVASSWQSLGGNLSSDPSAVTDGNQVWVFVRTGGRQIDYKVLNGGWSGWQHLGGSVLGDPKAFASLFGPTVLARADDGQVWYNDVAFGRGSDWKIMWNPDSTGVNPLGEFNAVGISTFMIGRSGQLYRGSLSGPFSGWQGLGGGFAPVTAA